MFNVSQYFIILENILGVLFNSQTFSELNASKTFSILILFFLSSFLGVTLFFLTATPKAPQKKRIVSGQHVHHLNTLAPVFFLCVSVSPMQSADLVGNTKITLPTSVKTTAEPIMNKQMTSAPHTHLL